MRKYAKPVYAVPVAAWIGCAVLVQFIVSGMGGHLEAGGMMPSGQQVAAQSSVAPPNELANADDASVPVAVERVGEAAGPASNPELADSGRDGKRI